MASVADKLLNPRSQNPFTAYRDAKKHGGNTMNAVLDPNQHILDSGPKSKKEAENFALKAKKKRKKKQLAKSRAMGAPYKKGGQVKSKSCCRGMGCATRGGRFHKDG